MYLNTLGDALTPEGLTWMETHGLVTEGADVEETFFVDDRSSTVHVAERCMWGLGTWEAVASTVRNLSQRRCSACWSARCEEARRTRQQSCWGQAKLAVELSRILYVGGETRHLPKDPVRLASRSRDLRDALSLIREVRPAFQSWGASSLLDRHQERFEGLSRQISQHLADPALRSGLLRKAALEALRLEVADDSFSPLLVERCGPVRNAHYLSRRTWVLQELQRVWAANLAVEPSLRSERMVAACRRISMLPARKTLAAEELVLERESVARTLARLFDDRLSQYLSDEKFVGAFVSVDPTLDSWDGERENLLRALLESYQVVAGRDEYTLHAPRAVVDLFDHVTRGHRREPFTLRHTDAQATPDVLEVAHTLWVSGGEFAAAQQALEAARLCF